MDFAYFEANIQCDSIRFSGYSEFYFMGNFCGTRLGGNIVLPARWFWIALTIAVAKRYYFHRSGIVFLDSYLLDLFCMPLVLEAISISMKMIFTPSYKLSSVQIAFALLSVSLLFEYFLPKHQTRFYADGFDVLAYSVGTLIWWLFLRK